MKPLRAYRATVLVVAVVGFATGTLLAHLTGQYLAVFVVQLMVAALIAAWYPRARKAPAHRKNPAP